MDFSRSSILNLLIEKIEAQLSAEENDLEIFKKFTGLSKATMKEKIAEQEQLIAHTKSLLTKAKNLKSSNGQLNLIVYQYKMGDPPKPSDPKSLASTNQAWKGLRAVAYRPDFAKLAVGTKQSSYHSRAEQEEYEVILAKA